MEDKKIEIELPSLSPVPSSPDNNEKKESQTTGTSESNAAAPKGAEEENSFFDNLEMNEINDNVPTIHLGNTIGLWFVNGMPLFTVGPDCMT